MIERTHRAVFAAQLQQRRRGRPRRDMPVVVTSVKVPQDVYDALCLRALHQRASVHALLLDALASYAKTARI